MPLDQHIEDSHGEREPRLQIRPPAVHDFLEDTWGKGHSTRVTGKDDVLVFSVALADPQSL